MVKWEYGIAEWCTYSLGVHYCTLHEALPVLYLPYSSTVYVEIILLAVLIQEFNASKVQSTISTERDML